MFWGFLTTRLRQFLEEGAQKGQWRWGWGEGAAPFPRLLISPLVMAQIICL